MGFFPSLSPPSPPSPLHKDTARRQDTGSNRQRGTETNPAQLWLEGAVQQDSTEGRQFGSSGVVSVLVGFLFFAFSATMHLKAAVVQKEAGVGVWCFRVFF